MRESPYPLVDPDVAARQVLDCTPVLAAEEVDLQAAAGRVLAQDVVAAEALPRWRVSAVDGYAIQAPDGGSRVRLVGESAAGRPYAGMVERGTAVRILTGGVLPPGADAIVMQEEVDVAGSTATVPAARAGQNVHFPGADAEAGQLLIERGTELGPAELGLAGSLGLARVRVHRRPAVALLTTGDELVEIGVDIAPGQVPDSNRLAIAAALREAGAEVRLLGIAPDDAGELRRLVLDALPTCDALVTSGGVSVGSHDLVKPLLESIGEVHVGRVRLRPGKPFTFATLPERRLAFGLPGFPVSSLITFEVFVRPALRRMQGYASLHRPVFPVRLDYEARAPGDRTEYQRVILRREGGELVARSTGSQSSSRLKSLVGANALVKVPAGAAPLPPGSVVEALILSLPT